MTRAPARGWEANLEGKPPSNGPLKDSAALPPFRHRPLKIRGRCATKGKTPLWDPFERLAAPAYSFDSDHMPCGE